MTGGEFFPRGRFASCHATSGVETRNDRPIPD